LPTDLAFPEKLTAYAVLNRLTGESTLNQSCYCKTHIKYGSYQISDVDHVTEIAEA
jgi:hypothetical protein